MDDFLGILLVAVFYIFIAVSGNKKKKARNGKQRASRTRRTVFEQAFENMEEAPAQTSVTQEPGEACEGKRLHLHEVTQQQFRESAEGEDPCHRGGAQEAEDVLEETAFSYDEQEQADSALAQDVLRGVIMSEILKRPSERAAIRRNERSKK